MPPQEANEAPVSFEEALAELESIANRLEEGELPLDEALALYEKGVRRLRQCHEALEKAERKISLLTGITEAGEAVVEPFEDTTGTLEEKAASRSRRRSS